LQDLRELSLEDVRPTKLPLLLAGMDSARRTLHTLRLTFVKEDANPDIPLALEQFTTLTYVPIGALPFELSSYLWHTGSAPMDLQHQPTMWFKFITNESSLRAQLLLLGAQFWLDFG
jgi:hypothetical protein